MYNITNLIYNGVQSMKKFIIALLTLSSLMLISCSKTDNLENTLSQINQKTFVMASPYKNTEISITFNNDKISGYSGVNRYMGSFEIVNKGKPNEYIAFGDVASTKMAGPKENMDIEKDFYDNLKASKSIKLKGDKLLIGNMSFIEKK